MKRAIFIFTLVAAMMTCPAWAASNRARAAFRDLQAAFYTFHENVYKLDQGAIGLRHQILGSRWAAAGQRARRLRVLTQLTSRQWNLLNEKFWSYRTERLNLFQPDLREGDESIDFLTYLAAARDARGKLGAPMNLLTRLWLGLSFGESISTLPRDKQNHFIYYMRTDNRRPIGLQLGGRDFVVIMTVNGGCVKGWFAGERNGIWYLAEDSELGTRARYRALDPVHAARLEIIQTLVDRPPLDTKGRYRTADIVRIFRASYRPSDVELLNAVDNRSYQSILEDEPPTVEMVDLKVEAAPDYTRPAFLTCPSFLFGG